tara:strand:- start:2111 stop:2290 length:180 start_codon:yes stop_codon:yes gene_type:complete
MSDKSYDEFKAEMESTYLKMVKLNKDKNTNTLQEVKRSCKEFRFNIKKLKGESMTYIIV